MAGNIGFAIDVTISNPDVLPELRGRVADMSPAFQAFIVEWARLNGQNFDKSRGMESSGAVVDELVRWAPLKESTMKAKRAKGQADQIMVATGDLERALSSPDLIFQKVGPQDAVFGTPLALEEANKVGYNWMKRQSIFFSTIDQNALRRILKDYLEMGADFQEKRFAKRMEAVARRAESQKLDMDFQNTTGPGDGIF